MGVLWSFIGVGVLTAAICGLILLNRKSGRELKKLEERRIALEQINSQMQELAHHQRLQTIGALTSSIAHEFNNLLTPIMSYSLMTLEKLPPEEEELYDNVLEIYNASQKAKVIISRLSDLARKNSPRNFHFISLDEQVKKALDIAMAAKPEQVEVQLNLNCWDQRIHANEIQICQLLLNMILNAFQALGEQGVLKMDATFDESTVTLVIADNGCGMTKEVQKQIFEPFFTTKETGKGTGLGLAIAAQVVEDHRGTIEVESRLGEGTRFEIRLPRLTEAELKTEEAKENTNLNKF